MTLKGFLEIADVDNDTVNAYLKSLYEFKSEIENAIHRERINPEFLRCIQIVGGRARAIENYQDVLRQRLTIYASAKATAYAQRLQEIINGLNKLEDEYRCQGLSMQALHLTGNGYDLDKEALQRIRD